MPSINTVCEIMSWRIIVIVFVYTSVLNVCDSHLFANWIESIGILVRSMVIFLISTLSLPIYPFFLSKNLCTMYFKGKNFCGKKLSRFRKTAKYLHFAGINFRGWSLMKNFAGINFRGEPLSKDFTGIKKAKFLNLWEETFVFIVLWLRCGTWPVLKSLKKSFKKLIFHYSFFLEFLIFWNFTNAIIIWYYNYKSVFFKEYSQMTTFL